MHFAVYVWLVKSTKAVFPYRNLTRPVVETLATLLNISAGTTIVFVVAVGLRITSPTWKLCHSFSPSLLDEHTRRWVFFFFHLRYNFHILTVIYHLFTLYTVAALTKYYILTYLYITSPIKIYVFEGSYMDVKVAFRMTVVRIIGTRKIWHGMISIKFKKTSRAFFS